MTSSADKSLSRGFSTDMSSDAIKRRLEIVNELYQLGAFLSRAELVGRVQDLDRAAANVESPARDSARPE